MPNSPQQGYSELQPIDARLFLRNIGSFFCRGLALFGAYLFFSFSDLLKDFFKSSESSENALEKISRLRRDFGGLEHCDLARKSTHVAQFLQAAFFRTDLTFLYR